MFQKQRRAIDKAKIRKQFKPMGEFLLGLKAYKTGLLLSDNPFTGKEAITWRDGWFWGRETVKIMWVWRHG